MTCEQQFRAGLAGTFALVKRFGLELKPPEHSASRWIARHPIGYTGGDLGFGDDPNHAICLCVARMQLAKERHD